MKKQLLWTATLALSLTACSDDAINADRDLNNEPVEPTFKTAKLTSVKSSQGRVTVKADSRAAMPGSLTLHAEIDNLSKEEGRITGFEKEYKDGRYLSATSVYYDQSSETYYVTYHMQGNNYNTSLIDQTSGYVESFTIDANGDPVVGKIYMSANPSEKDFDFNHLYFDNLVSPSIYVGDYTADSDTESRLIAVGHLSEPTSTGKAQTKAIIARLNLEEETIDYAPVLTGEKLLDEDGKSLGNIDAGDANCVVRKYNHYYLATRKGIAVLKAAKDELFAPEVDDNDNLYFIKSPGSTKYISQPTTTSYIKFLYLTENTPEGFNYDTAIPAKIAEFAIDTRYNDRFLNLNSLEGFKLEDWSNQVGPINAISPVDGKNMFAADSYYTASHYVCLGKNGLYVHNPMEGWNEHIVTFSDVEGGSRPVNGVFVEDYESDNGYHVTDGFIYVANGACLTILDGKTLEKVAEYSAFKEGDASANFIHVVKTKNYTNSAAAPDRIITVAYGQAGVKVFKFVPPTKR